MIVVIDLQKEDDPQVIFETLNARGEPLLPADLLRNYVFFRAGRDKNVDVETVYEKYWSRFDDEFWREETKQGRLTRPRGDLFMQHFLASRQGREIPIKHLYVEYRHWIETVQPFDSVTSELSALARQREFFRRIVAPEPGDIIYDLCTFLEAYDIRTSYPLLLALLEADIDDAEWRDVSAYLESYLLRRAVCNLGTKNYNRIFLALTRNLRRDGFTAEKLKELLLEQTGDSGVWPDDARFRESWVYKPLYGPLNSPKLVHLFKHLNGTYMSSKSEALVFSQQPSVEHLMPQEWISNWKLPDGTMGLNVFELYKSPDTLPRAVATRKRDTAVQCLGNLTILSTGLNSAQSNYGWEDKLPVMLDHSLLPLNQSFSKAKSWDEDSIRTRGEELFARALKIWPR